MNGIIDFEIMTNPIFCGRSFSLATFDILRISLKQGTSDIHRYLKKSNFWRFLFPPLKKMMHRAVAEAEFIICSGGDSLVHKRFGFLDGCLDIIAPGHITGDR